MKRPALDDPFRPVDGAGIVVAVPQGGEFAGPALAQAVAAALRRHEVPASSGNGGNGASLRLTAAFAEPRDAKALALRWTLQDAAGRLLGAFEHPVAPADLGVNFGKDKAELLAALADAAAAGVVGLLDEAPETAPRPRFPELLVPPVPGAPGDGMDSLRQAMERALVAAGAPLAPEYGDGTHLVLGSVMVSETPSGVQQVEVLWEVIAPDGRRLGTVSQENTVPGGTLDGEWGSIAAAIAAGGASGVIEILARADSS